MLQSHTSNDLSFPFSLFCVVRNTRHFSLSIYEFGLSVCLFVCIQ